MLILDTSFLFALFKNGDEFHDRAKLISEDIKHELLYFPFLVFQELMTLIMCKYSSKEAMEISDLLLAKDSPCKILKIDEEYFEQSVEMFKKLGKHKLSFVDVSLIVLARELGAKIITFDGGLQKALADI